VLVLEPALAQVLVLEPALALVLGLGLGLDSQ
jgi:hypothetical protein